MRTLSLTEARRLVVGSLQLAEPRPRSILEVAERLGRIQIDPTAVVARAEQLTLFSRLGPYPLDELKAALEERRELFEYIAFLIPTSDLPLHRPVMRRYPPPEHSRGRYVREWLNDNVAFRDYVLSEIRSRGSLRTRDLDDRAEVPWQTGGWNDGKNLGRMLEILWRAGELAVARRDGSERVWDLFERVLPAEVEELPDEIVALETMERQLRAQGLVDPKFGRAFDGQLPARDVAFESLLTDEVAVPVRVDGYPGEWLAHREGLAELDNGVWRPRTTLIGPFDPLVADRERAEALFDFRFRLEIYMPVAKREYGYYVLPILHGERLIGRIDPVMDRKRHVLTVNAVYAEADAPRDAWPAVKAAIQELGEWLCADEIRLPTLPAPWATRPAVSRGGG